MSALKDKLIVDLTEEEASELKELLSRKEPGEPFPLKVTVSLDSTAEDVATLSVEEIVIPEEADSADVEETEGEGAPETTTDRWMKRKPTGKAKMSGMGDGTMGAAGAAGSTQVLPSMRH